MKDINRREAIKTACALAEENDIILVAGKGHETYQEIKGERFPFDDLAILEVTLKKVLLQVSCSFCFQIFF